MKRILIAHIPNTLNYGSAMMAINLIAGIRERVGQKVEIYCDCDEYNLDRLKTATGDPSLKSFLVKKADPNRSKFQKAWEWLSGTSNIVMEVSSQFHMMIVLGGDDMSETYMKGAMLCGLQYCRINRKCRVVLAGQSLGPFSGIYSLLARWLFSDVTVFTRDDNSYEFCAGKLNLPHVFQSRDLAIHPLPLQEKWNHICATLDLEDNAYVVIVPSGLVSLYTDDRIGYIATWLEIIRLIMQRDKHLKVVVLAHVLSPEGSSDVLVIEEMLKHFLVDEKERLIVCDSPMQPAEARAVLGNAKFVVTGRMHAAISTFYSGKPAISLAYSEKYMGVIGRGLDLAELIIDCRDQRWGKKSHILEEVTNGLNNIENNYEKLIQKIALEIDKCQDMVKYQLDMISNHLN